MDEARFKSGLRESIANTVAKNVMLARRIAGLTQDALAEAAGISRATINQIESGEGDPRLSTLVDISDALGIRPILLVLGDEEMEALKGLVASYEAYKHKLSASIAGFDECRFLLRSGLQKNMVKAAALGAETAADLEAEGPKPAAGSEPGGKEAVAGPLLEGIKSAKVAGASIGAAIGTVLFPGMGTAIGSLLGMYLAEQAGSKKS